MTDSLAHPRFPGHSATSCSAASSCTSLSGVTSVEHPSTNPLSSPCNTTPLQKQQLQLGRHLRHLFKHGRTFSPKRGGASLSSGEKRRVIVSDQIKEALLRPSRKLRNMFPRGRREKERPKGKEARERDRQRKETDHCVRPGPSKPFNRLRVSRASHSNQHDPFQPLFIRPTPEQLGQPGHVPEREGMHRRASEAAPPALEGSVSSVASISRGGHSQESVGGGGERPTGRGGVSRNWRFLIRKDETWEWGGVGGRFGTGVSVSGALPFKDKRDKREADSPCPRVFVAVRNAIG